MVFPRDTEPTVADFYSSAKSHSVIRRKLKLTEGATIVLTIIFIRGPDSATAIENYIVLNDTILNRWRVVPLASSKQGFVSFSEKELASFFVGMEKASSEMRLQDLARLDNTTVTSTDDFDAWVNGQPY
ncbi:hypothetical protein EC991_002501 [Linnemannia zychae]|nr:hypothetical protein EC991_002501 [Linnemannia zychae]